ncbi:unnamed protein product [Commensalibacter communis]|uniref:Uncharacterized protein n=1 Tax=Commensalibacter communis TaxID=2972786 RepID=A0A9W4X6S9_9PROT|nr:AtzG-like protein [Commensalibacter communis]CAI3922515.1 unnamed protein product [Commensalibacter communis]CAI3934438.1 unnamed protein product [Commensalibacter communis]CAI3944076.1 unnamed protein product [Commensalibacter communis]CAI3945557.1 unnamed protein product [Commensalibacter communis]CAI3946442.1 unnamed protein product [Commensalibacter communis]
MHNDLSYQLVQMLSDSIDLIIPDKCKDGVTKNTELLHQYSKLIHQFDIPKIKE